jgi:hypothetical protein
MKEMLFKFHSSGTTPPQGQVFVIRIPAGITKKRALLELFAAQLKFPDYFGFNWDALDECLADLSWLEHQRFCFWHDDIPLATNPDEARNYIEVLNGVIGEREERHLSVSFPEEARKTIESLLGSK